MRHPKIRDLVRALIDAGWSPVRTRGSHQVWAHASGAIVPLPINHLGDDASPQVARSVLRAIQRSRSQSAIGEHAAPRENGK